MNENGSQFALDLTGQWVNAVTAPKRRGVKYFCDCPDRHRMKLVKPLGLGKRPFRDFFSHISERKNKEGKEHYHSCRGGGESLEHRTAKQMLRELQGTYSFALERCSGCKYTKMEHCVDGTIILEQISEDRKWRYDCMLQREGRNVLALEVVKSHYSTKTKIESTRRDGIDIAEFRVEDVLLLKKGAVLENLCLKVIQCDGCRQGEMHTAILVAYREEVLSIHKMDEMIDLGYQKMWEHNQFKKFLGVDQVADAKHIFKLYCSQITIGHPRFGDIKQMDVEKEDRGGLFLKHASEIPANYIYIRFLDSPDIYGVNWHVNGMEDDFIMFLHCSTMIRSFWDLERGDKVYFKDCKWPILKVQESQHKICANCAIYGHTSEQCYRKLCVKCGRKGHLKKMCFAKYDILGNYIEY
jgi:hypothetical protein